MASYSQIKTIDTLDGATVNFMGATQVPYTVSNRASPTAIHSKRRAYVNWADRMFKAHPSEHYKPLYFILYQAAQISVVS